LNGDPSGAKPQIPDLLRLIFVPHRGLAFSREVVQKLSRNVLLHTSLIHKALPNALSCDRA
jgi:hypothetical protein